MQVATKRYGPLALSVVALLLLALLAASAALERAEIQVPATPVSESAHWPGTWVVHNPPLLVTIDEEVELTYEVICAATSARPCPQGGTVHLRAPSEGSFAPVPLSAGAEGILSATVPRALLDEGKLYYYATLGEGDDPLTVPSGGAEAPQAVWLLDHSTPVRVEHRFGVVRDSDHRPFTARWGAGPGQAGLEPGDESLGVGPSSFDVGEDGRVVLVDQVNRRLTLVTPGVGVRHVPAEVTSALPDIALDLDGSVHVLESSAPDGGAPLLKHFDPEGRALGAVRIADRIPSKVRMGAGGPQVLQYPSAMWMPATDGRGRALPPRAQARRERPHRPQADGTGLVVKATPEEIRVALTDGSWLLAAWRMQTPPGSDGVRFGEVQLAERFGSEVVVVFAVFNEDLDEFKVLRLSPDGLLADFSVPSRRWVESAPTSRFRLDPRGSLLQLQSAPEGLSIVGYELGGRSKP